MDPHGAKIRFFRIIKGAAPSPWRGMGNTGKSTARAGGACIHAIQAAFRTAQPKYEFRIFINR